MAKSNRSGTTGEAQPKPKKPYATYPLTPHASGKWMKKIRGTIFYFGKWGRRVGGKLVRVEGDGWKEALAEYQAVADDLHAGRTPRVKADGLTVKDLCNQFLTSKMRKVEAGELTTNLFADYKIATDALISSVGADRRVDDLAADDFATLRAAMAKKWGPVRLGNTITRIKTAFKYAYEAGLMDRPIRYGPEFAKPDKSILRRHRAGRPAKMFESAEVRELVDGKPGSGDQTVRASVAMRAMILLGINCGFGNTDCSELKLKGLDLDGGWVDFPRPKTGIARRCALWPETVAALQTAIAARPEPTSRADAARVFLTASGSAFVVQTELGFRNDIIGTQFGKLLKALGIQRSGVGFYALRHTFETIGGSAKDQVAVDLVMGHTDPSMAGVYRERIDDSRLRAVADHVRAWLWPTTAVPA